MSTQGVQLRLKESNRNFMAPITTETALSMRLAILTTCLKKKICRGRRWTHRRRKVHPEEPERVLGMLSLEKSREGR